jgi:hypothetical protein
MLRLEILRLHAEGGTPHELTRELSAAMRIGDRLGGRLPVPVPARGPTPATGTPTAS